MNKKFNADKSKAIKSVAQSQAQQQQQEKIIEMDISKSKIQINNPSWTNVNKQFMFPKGLL